MLYATEAIAVTKMSVKCWTTELSSFIKY